MYIRDILINKNVYLMYYHKFHYIINFFLFFCFFLLSIKNESQSFSITYSLPWPYLLFDSQLRDTAFDRCTPRFRVFTTLLFYLFLSFGSPSARSPSALYLHSTISLRRPRSSIRLGSMRRPALLFDQPYESSDLKPSARAAP